MPININIAGNGYLSAENLQEGVPEHDQVRSTVNLFNFTKSKIDALTSPSSNAYTTDCSPKKTVLQTLQRIKDNVDFLKNQGTLSTANATIIVNKVEGMLDRLSLLGKKRGYEEMERGIISLAPEERNPNQETRQMDQD